MPADDPGTAADASGGLSIRLFTAGDAPALLNVHRSAIRRTAASHYTPAQIEAWAPTEFDIDARDAWCTRVAALRPWVACWGSSIVGYADLQADGLIDHFFVAPEHGRRGIGSALMARIHADAASRGIGRLHAHVSLAAQPFFAHHGFRVMAHKQVERRGQMLVRALMGKALDRSSERPLVSAV